MATGVLPLLIGKAAVMQEKLSDHDKTYIAGIRLGVSTDTGDVTGSLLSAKVFVVTTDTGTVQVPKSTAGGRCEISTDTGDIRITVP